MKPSRIFLDKMISMHNPSPRQIFLLLLILVLSALGTGCGKSYIFSNSGSGGGSPGSTAAPSGTFRPYTIDGITYHPLQSADGFTEEGLASWYGRDFHGRRTANGEIYDMYAMTAAHKLLPMGTVVRVTRLDSGRSVDVRINDRGPFVRERVIDLSYTAAEKLNMVGQGTARVRVEAIGGTAGTARATRDNIPGTFYVQVGSFTVEANAQNLVSAMRQRGYGDSRLQTVMIQGRWFWRVQAGSFPNLNAARTAKARLEGEFPSCFIIAD